MTTGYSGTPLPKKLGLRPGTRAAVRGAPAGFSLDAPLVEEAPFDVLVAFFDRKDAFARALPDLVASLSPKGFLWIAWPKKASGVPTDLTEDRIRDHVLPLGLVDTKVCAIDATWSGLRLNVRRESR